MGCELSNNGFLKKETFERLINSLKCKANLRSITLAFGYLSYIYLY